ncbi:NAD(P)H-dependent oxidoreductase [Pseudomonas sp. TH49]|jgi:NAD(P)H dehydrogenase (quinone)|uniref:NAD(P)H-dependent oxidoreductase n=1 Tax=unclassified Pseudomonas TaxID=196821 RepID=UPI001911586E|nr:MULTISPECIES: NAD(P)H-dependent oxidoreductase [unclassified Pseudomonas]MBK5344131.1 NAD(P)H-dependent oxidoreductase [Pseudomonas sp. TH49]MCU1771491.1 NAD(P)H-dependent oxidoreductase [Pseudomonas sp. 13B_3.2_Bac1]
MNNQVRKALVIVTHPVPGSLSHAIADHIGEVLVRQDIEVEIADLHAEGFSPAMTAGDVMLYRGAGDIAPEITREQARVHQADMLVFVFPVYWWSVPSMLKGWLERVFNVGWAYSVDEKGRVIGIMRDIPVLLVATAAGNESGYERHGYAQAIQNQIVEGVFGYSGMKNTQIAYFYDADNATNERIEQFVEGVSPLLEKEQLLSSVTAELNQPCGPGELPLLAESSP